MTTKVAKCEMCFQTFPLTLMRYTKIDGVYRYVCSTCRKELKVFK